MLTLFYDIYLIIINRFEIYQIKSHTKKKMLKTLIFNLTINLIVSFCVNKIQH